MLGMDNFVETGSAVGKKKNHAVRTCVFEIIMFHRVILGF